MFQFRDTIIVTVRIKGRVTIRFGMQYGIQGGVVWMSMAAFARDSSKLGSHVCDDSIMAAHIK